MQDNQTGKITIASIDRTFSKLSDLRELVQAEASFWAWLKPAAPGSIRRPIDEFLSAAEALSGSNTNENAVKAADSLDAAFKAGLPYSASTMGVFIDDLRAKEGGPVALGALAYLSNSAPMSESWESIKGFLFAIRFEECRPENSEHANEAFEQFLNDLRQRASEDHGRIEREHEAASNSLQDAKQALIKRNSELTALRDEFTKQFKELDELYRSQIRLKAPTTYWTAKREEHTRAKKLWLGATACAAVIWILALVSISIGAKPKNLEMGNLNSFLDAGRYAALLVLTTVVGIWAIRICVRLFLASYHLETDAHERVVMVDTFQALKADPKAHLTNEQDRLLILEALFRHSADGVIPDDAAPELIDAIHRLVRR